MFQPGSGPSAAARPSAMQPSPHLLVQHPSYGGRDEPLSPLDALVRNGKQARRDARNAAGRAAGLSQDLLTRAHSLSRSTSIRTAHPTTVSEDPESDTSAAYTDQDSSAPSRAGPSASSLLVRRDSVDTVRSSEFGADGRWAKAWTTKPDDELSLYDDDNSSINQWDAESYMSADTDWTPRPAGQPSDEDEFRQAQAMLAATPTQVDFQPQQQHDGRLAASSQEQPYQHAPSVGQPTAMPATYAPGSVLVWPPTPQATYQGAIPGLSAKRESTATLREEQLPLQPPASSQSDTRTFSSSPDRMTDEQRDAIFQRHDGGVPLRARHQASTGPTSAHPVHGDYHRRASHSEGQRSGPLGTAGYRTKPIERSFSGPEAATSSANSYLSQSGAHLQSGQGRPDQSRQQQPRSASNGPLRAPPSSFRAPESAQIARPIAGSSPIAPGMLLNQATTINQQLGTSPAPPQGDIAALRSPRGHPAGRMPPPPPPGAEDFATNGRPISGRYTDPNGAFPSQAPEQDWTASLGKHRAAVLAAHDGRASLVSDLDVETLRLDDASSRRSSTSTLGLAYQQGQPQHHPPPGSRQQPPGHVQNALPGAPPSGREAPVRRSGEMRRDPRSSSDLPRSQTSSSVAASSPHPSTMTGTFGSQSGSSVASAHKPAPKQISTAEELLSRGIEYHEAGDLSRSVFYFERSAKVEGGCVVGMCMYGMALREGWGAKKDPRRGFEWIQAAATRAGETLKVNQPRTEAEIHALKSELKLAVYELGKCYCYGWGVKMDKRMALEYFELAAKLGDADAQAEAGALYATGKGCKKDLKKAARYYRMAEAQGYDTVGLSWIHKDKYL